MKKHLLKMKNQERGRAYYAIPVWTFGWRAGSAERVVADVERGKNVYIAPGFRLPMPEVVVLIDKGWV